MKDNIAKDFNGKALPQVGNYTDGGAKIINAKAPYLSPDIKIIPSSKLEDQIYFAVGARPWARDPIDFKILSDVAEGRGQIINTQEQNYIGYPKYAPVSKPFNEAEWNLDVLEMLFEFLFVRPEAIKKKRDALNSKLTDAGKNPMK
mgnify:CR=1 FL=1